MNTYPVYLIVRFILFILRWLPINLALALGRLMGNLAYFFNTKQRKIGYSNLKAAFSQKKEPKDLKRILKESYQNLGQVLVEITRFPRLNNDYIEKFVKIEGIEHAKEAKSKDKGLIFLTAHFGNWELGAQAFSIKGYPMKILTREQKLTRLNNLLNSLRSANNCQVVTKGIEVRSILRSLRSNETLGMLADQDARKDGVLIDFFGRYASTPRGAITIALKTQSTVIPTFIIRERGPRHTLYIHEPLKFQNVKLETATIQKALQDYHEMLMIHIEENPEQWLWIQKRWKSTPMRSVLILSDGKAGHLNQAKAVAELIKVQLENSGLLIKSPYAKNKGCKIIEVKFKNNLSSLILNTYSLFASYCASGCMRCLKMMIDESSYKELINNYADYIISCGSKLAPVNLILSKENYAKSIVIMKPPLKLKSFDLAIIPKHDKPHRALNVVITDGAPNLINKRLINEHKSLLEKELNLKEGLKVGFFFGGGTPSYTYIKFQIERMLSEIKRTVVDLDAELLMTTSRRTSPSFELLIKESLKDFDRCKLLIIASKENPPETIGGILGLSDVVVVSFDSISMISEAVNSRKYVVVLAPDNYASLKTPKKHKRLIDNFEACGFIHISEVSNINKVLKHILKTRPKIKNLEDNEKISKALRAII